MIRTKPTRGGSRVRHGLAVLALLHATAALNLRAVEPPPPYRPLPGTGAGTLTLLLYSDQYVRYSLVDALESLALRLRRVDTILSTVPLGTVSADQLHRADYVVVFCPQPPDPVPEVFLTFLAQAKRPVLWVGYGIEQLETNPPWAGQFHVATDQPERVASRIIYRDRAWVLPPAAWVPISLARESQAPWLMAVETGQAARPLQPVCWTTDHVTFFAGLPTEGPLGYLFEDMLLDFFQVQDVAPAWLFLRLDDYHPHSDHRRFLRMVDFLYSHDLPFMVSMTPASREARTGRMEDLDSTPAFANALRYAQQRGGRIVVRGCVRPPSEAGEFWDLRRDAPPQTNLTAYVRHGLEQSCRQLIRHGLLPLAWKTPHSAAASEATGELARFFSTAVDQVQLSDATRHALYTPVNLTRDKFGRVIVPENLGFIPEAPPGTSGSVTARARPLLDLRGAVLGCDFPVNLTLAKLMALVDQLESLQVPFLDLQSLDHWVHWPGGLLLTGRAKFRTQLSSGPVRWRAFDRLGRLVGETTAATLFSGDRSFERRGLGVVELYETMEGEP